MTEHGIEVPNVIGTTRLGPIGMAELDELLEQAYLEGHDAGAYYVMVEIIEWEYGWAGDAQATTFYETREEAEEYMGDPRLFQRRVSGPWIEAVDNYSEAV